DSFVANVIVRDAAKVDPAMGVLMAEERGEMNEAPAVAGFPFIATDPVLPGFRRQGIAFRAKAQQIEDHRLIVANPAPRDEAGFRVPTHRECGAVTRAFPLRTGAEWGRGPSRVGHPIPVD